jgi:hypothetical protein
MDQPSFEIFFGSSEKSRIYLVVAEQLTFLQNGSSY